MGGEVSGWDGVVGDYRVTRYTAEAKAEAAEWRAGMRELCRPLDDRGLLAALVRLRSATMSRTADTTETELALETLADELAPYPADIVLDVLTEWPRRSRWWPTIADLLPLLQRELRPRQALLRALDTIAAAEIPPRLIEDHAP